MEGDKHGLMLPTWLAERYDGTYLDGRRLDELQFLQCKLILKPDRLTSARVFKEFAHLVHRAADVTGVAYHHTPKLDKRPEPYEKPPGPRPPQPAGRQRRGRGGSTEPFFQSVYDAGLWVDGSDPDFTMLDVRPGELAGAPQCL